MRQPLKGARLPPVSPSPSPTAAADIRNQLQHPFSSQGGRSPAAEPSARPTMSEGTSMRRGGIHRGPLPGNNGGLLGTRPPLEGRGPPETPRLPQHLGLVTCSGRHSAQVAGGFPRKPRSTAAGQRWLQGDWPSLHVSSDASNIPPKTPRLASCLPKKRVRRHANSAGPALARLGVAARKACAFGAGARPSLAGSPPFPALPSLPRTKPRNLPG